MAHFSENNHTKAGNWYTKTKEPASKKKTNQPAQPIQHIPTQLTTPIKRRGTDLDETIQSNNA